MQAICSQCLNPLCTSYTTNIFCVMSIWIVTLIAFFALMYLTDWFGNDKKYQTKEIKVKCSECGKKKLCSSNEDYSFNLCEECFNKYLGVEDEKIHK